MKMNRVIALMTAMLLTFSLTACAESSAAPELDGKTEYELLEVENEILLANNALWEKVFLSMSKNVTDDVISSNYGDVLMSAVEGAKEQFSEEEYEKLKADAEQIRTIEEKIAEISESDASGQPEDAAQGDAFPQFTGKDLDGNDVDNSLFSANAFDRNGRIVGEPLLGGIDNEKNLEMLQKTIDEALARDSAVLSK